jgi:hypothetical protein
MTEQGANKAIDGIAMALITLCVILCALDYRYITSHIRRF